MKILMLCIACIMLTACGQSGKLYLPAKEVPTIQKEKTMSMPRV